MIYPDMGLVEYEQALCQNKLNILIDKAMSVCRWRGHLMGTWQENPRQGRAYSNCLACGAQAAVDVDPLPNGIDICGSAVATHCC